MLKIKFENIVLLFVFLLVAFPYPNYVLFHVSGLQIKYQQLIHLFGALVIILFSFELKFRGWILYFFLLFISYVFLQIIWSGNPLAAVKHSSVYSAFTVAVAFQALQLRIDARRLLETICQALTLGLLIAACVNLFFNDFVVNQISDDGYATDDAKYRLYWTGALIALPIVFLCIIQRIKYRSLYVLALTLGIVFAMNRTIYLAYSVLIIFFFSYGLFRVNLTKIVTALCGLILLLFFLISLDTKFGSVFADRVLSDDVFEVALFNTRFLLYEQYLNTISIDFNYLLGSGLGWPVAKLGDYYLAYYTDISILTFLLPLGLCGLLFLISFVVINFSDISRVCDVNLRVALKLLLVIIVVVSLNVDVYARSDLVIVIALLVGANSPRSSTYRSMRSVSAHTSLFK